MNSSPRCHGLVLITLLAACGGRPRPAVDSVATTAPVGATGAPADSHLLDLDDGTAVWLTAGRAASRSDGHACRERGIELRKGDRRVTVPLLYTVDDPVVLRGVLVASVSANCLTGALYSIDPTTGQPTPFDRRP